jgi:hypothetical protein
MRVYAFLMPAPVQSGRDSPQCFWNPLGATLTRFESRAPRCGAHLHECSVAWPTISMWPARSPQPVELVGWPCRYCPCWPGFALTGRRLLLCRDPPQVTAHSQRAEGGRLGDWLLMWMAVAASSARSVPGWEFGGSDGGCRHGPWPLTGKRPRVRRSCCRQSAVPGCDGVRGGCSTGQIA